MIILKLRYLIFFFLTLLLSCNIKPYEVTNEYVSIYGYEHYVEYYIQEKDKPVVLVLHGGPGAPYENAFEVFDPSMLEHFNIVLWHQKNSGNSDKRNSALDGLSVEHYVGDAIKIIEHLKMKFEKDKLHILGHSWGSILGLELATRIPESIEKYISIAQIVNPKKTDEYNVDWLQNVITPLSHSQEADLEFLNTYNNIKKPAFADYVKLRKLMTKYSHKIDEQTNESAFNQGLFKWAISAEYLQFQMYHEYLETNFESLSKLEVPVTFIVGKHDKITPGFLVEKLYSNISNPDKKMVWFDESAHEPYKDEPEKFASLLLSELNSE